MESEIKIGTRIACEGECGTVLYIGEVESFEGTWLGIEWDRPLRGKHSGYYKGVKYFETREPNSGSFIRINKAKLGRSCPDAIKEKYGSSLNDKMSDGISLPQKSGKGRQVEMVGFEKVAGKLSQFHQLTEVVVSGMLVNGPGASGELKELIPNASSFDLSRNLLSTWNDVIAAVSQLPFVNSLILSKNRLKIPVDGTKYQNIFSGLKSLVLNCMTYDWNEVLTAACMWPYIEHLFVCDNKISLLEEPPHPLFCQLRYLNLENNFISSWLEICKLGKLPNLEVLYLDNIKLESICFPGVPVMEETECFPNLVSLSVRNNKLNNWQDIGELNKLRKLEDFQGNNNPIILSVSPETARQLIIAKITKLKKVNRTEIERSERRGAEIDYIKRFRNEWIANGGHVDLSLSQPSENFLSQHPTYVPLLKKHGCAEESEVEICSLLKNNLIPIEIFSPLMPDRPSVVKKLPASMTVCKLKALIRRIFNIPSCEIKLVCISPKGNNQESEMDNDLRQLSFYSVSSDDKICVTW